MSELLKTIRTSILLWLLISILTGLVYPLFTTLIAQILFTREANGSLLQKNNITIGSSLIGQDFNDPKYFWGRPSSTPLYPYNAVNSAGSNFGPLNPDYIQKVKERMRNLIAYPHPNTQIPIDLVTSSGSGLDPHISPASAFFQVQRVAKLRGISESDLSTIIMNQIENPTLGFLGEARINVLVLNLALDEFTIKRTLS